MADFRDLIIWLQMSGVIDVLIPFILIFTVVFAVLNKTKILGKKEEAKRYNVIVALAMGVATIVPHVLWGTADPTNPYLINGMTDVVKVMNNSLPNISVVVIAIIMVMLMLGVFGADLDFGGHNISFWMMAFSLGTVVYVFGTSAGFFGGGHFPRWLAFLEDPNTQSLLLMILVFGAIIWFITKEDKKEEKATPNWIKALEASGEKDKH